MLLWAGSGAAAAERSWLGADPAPRAAPCLVLIDDYRPVATGPRGFHALGLATVFGAVGLSVLIPPWPIVAAYARAAAFVASKRRHAVIVETDIRYAGVWTALLRRFCLTFEDRA